MILKKQKTDKYILYVLLIALFLSGCSQSTSKHIDQNPLLTQSVKYTKIIRIYNNNEISSILNISYLNRVEPTKFNDKEYFLVGLYENNSQNKVLSLNIDGKEFYMMDNVEKKYPHLIENIALSNKWAKYYLFIYDEIIDKTILQGEITYGLDKKTISILK